MCSRVRMVSNGIYILVLLLRYYSTEGRMHMMKIGPAYAWINAQSRERTLRMREVCPAEVGDQQHALATSSRMTVGQPKSADNRLPTSRIVEGEDAYRGMFPYAATFTYHSDSKGRTAYCGATLISLRHLITAAHCIPSQLEGKVAVLLDGVCIRHSTQDACSESPADVLQAVEIDFVTTHYYDYSGRDKRKHEKT